MRSYDKQPRKSKMYFFEKRTLECCCLLAKLCLTDSTPWTVTHLAPLWDCPGENTGMACHFLLQGIFLTQGSNTHLLH